MRNFAKKEPKEANATRDNVLCKLVSIFGRSGYGFRSYRPIRANWKKDTEKDYI